jgi:hypothetical protein
VISRLIRRVIPNPSQPNNIILSWPRPPCPITTILTRRLFTSGGFTILQR